MPSRRIDTLALRNDTMGLLDLPEELRDEIFSHILLKPQNTITMLSNSHCFRSEVSAAQPTISQVCKQLRMETLPVFYGSNRFLAELGEAEDLETARNWLATIGDSNVRYLRHLVLSGWTRRAHDEQGRQVGNYHYVRLVFDLREGKLRVEEQENLARCAPGVRRWIDGLKDSFRRMVGAKGGETFTAGGVRRLMEEFHRALTEAV